MATDETGTVDRKQIASRRPPVEIATVSASVLAMPGGSLYDDYSDPGATDTKLRSLLPPVEGERRLELLTQIGRSLGLQKKFDDAHKILDGIDLTDASPTVTSR